MALLTSLDVLFMGSTRTGLPGLRVLFVGAAGTGLPTFFPGLGCPFLVVREIP